MKAYSNLRNKAKALAAELRDQGIKQVYLDGNDEAMDILRLTCIEAGIALHDEPDGMVLKIEGQNYKACAVE